MRRIQVPVLWDQDNNFLNNALYSVDILSKVVTTVTKPVKIFPPQDKTPTTQSCLQIKEPEFNTLCLNISLSAYQAAIQAASGDSHPLVVTKVYTITGATSTITDAALSGANILALWIGWVSVDPTGLLSGDTITLPGSINNTTVAIMYYIN